MTVKTFDQRINQMEWHPSAVPSQQIVDDILGHVEIGTQRAEWIVAGAALGALIGFGVKGTIVPDAPFGPTADTLGFVVGALSLLSGAALVGLATIMLPLRKRFTRLATFSWSALLMVLVLLIS